MTELKHFIKTSNKFIYELAAECHVPEDQFRKKIDKKAELTARDLAYLSAALNKDPEEIQRMWEAEYEEDPYAIPTSPTDEFISIRGYDFFLEAQTDDAYSEYMAWCILTKREPDNKIAFSRRVNKRTGCTSKVVRRGDKLVRIFHKKYSTKLPTDMVK